MYLSLSLLHSKNGCENFSHSRRGPAHMFFFILAYAFGYNTRCNNSLGEFIVYTSP